MMLCRQAMLLIAVTAISATEAFTSPRCKNNVVNNISTCHYSTRTKQSWSELINETTDIDSPSRIEFISPLLQDGYPPAVKEYERV